MMAGRDLVQEILRDGDENYQVFKAAIDMAKSDPKKFAKVVLGVELDPWQEELIHAMLDIERKQNGVPTVTNHDGKNKITIRAMHGPGKTFGLATVMHIFNFIYRGRIIATAPKEKQLITRLFPAFRKIRSSSLKFYQSLMEVGTTKVEWCKDPDWCVIAETASQPENLAGYHDDFLLFVVEEASGVEEQLFPVIEGALSTGVIVCFIMISNPTKNVGTFWASHCLPKVAKNYHRIHVSLDKTTRVSRQWVQEMEDKYGADSPVVKIRCYGEFADDDENQLISMSWIDDARVAEKEGDGSIPRLRITVDVADGGVDESIITVAKMYESFTLIVKKYRYSFPTAKSPIMCAEAAMEIAEQWGYNIANGDDIVVDSLGVGAGTAGYIMKSGKFNVVVYKGGESSDDTKKWRNRRTQSYIGLRDAFRDNEIFYLDSVWDRDVDWEDHIAQLCSIRGNPASERVEDIMTKKEMKRQGIKSPDMSDGDAMVMATQVPVMGGGGAEPEMIGESLTSAYDGGLS